MPEQYETPARVILRARLTRAERAAVRAHARSKGMTLSAVMRDALASGWSARALRAAGLFGAQERASILDLIARLRAAGLGLNEEVRNLHGCAAGYGARPDLARMLDCLLDLVGASRAAQAFVARLAGNRRFARTAVVSVALDAAVADQLAGDLRASRLRPSSFLRRVLLHHIGADKPFPAAEELRLARGLLVQLRGARGNASRLLVGGPRGYVVANTADDGRALMRAAEDFCAECGALIDPLVRISVPSKEQQDG